ncbi:MAG: TonB-dependent receptor [Acidobacteriota bacterium]
MRKALKWGAWIAVALAVSGLAVFAQQGGGLQGKVTDEAGQPVIGATIQVSGPSLQGFQGTATDVNGQYVIPFLPVGKNYQVKVEAPGYNSVVRKGIEIPLGTTISLPFTLSQGKTEIVVTAAAPVIDTKKTEVGANISDTMISSIPLSRNSAGIAFLAPGAVSSGLADTPSIAGASGPENSYTVNGVDVTGSGDALNLTSLNFDFIEATEVKTGGLDAEFGALMGGNINSITKSGGNEFHGSLFAYYFDDNMGAQERKLRNPTVVNFRKAFKQYDIGGSLGGYFIKDKLWFFVAYDWNKTEQTFTANGYDNNVVLNGHPSYSWALGQGYKNTDKNPQYALKLTWNVNPNHKLSFSWFGNNDKYDYFANLNNPSPVASPRKSKTDNYAVSLQWNATWTPKFFTEAVIARRHTKDSNHPVNALAENSWGYYYRYGSGTYAGYQVIPTDGVPVNSYDTNPNSPTYRQVDLAAYSPSLGGRTREHTKDINDQIRLKATHLFDFHGRHELAYGFQYYDITYDYNFNYTGPGWTELYPGNPFYGRTTPGGAVIRWQVYRPTLGQFLYRAQGFMNDQNKKTSQKYYAYWAQDNWNLTDYFLLKVGVRLDQIHMKGGDNTVNVPAQIMNNPIYSNGKARKVNINDMWAPRIGFTWDVAHNGKSKLYGFWGYYYERIPNDLAIRALTDEYFHFSYFRDSHLTVPVNNPAYHYTYGLEPTKIVGGPNGGGLKGSYNKETILGFQYEIRPDFSMGARAIYRSIGRVIEDISVDGATSYIVTNPDKWTGVWAPDPLGRPGYWWRFPKPVRIYKALEITADKRFSNHWMLQGSYTLSRLKGNYEGLFSNDNGQLDPNITSKYDLPQLLVNAYGLLPNDRTHVLKVYGGYFFENIPLELSGNFTLQSGTPISKLGADDAYGINEGFCQPRGTAGRTPTLWQLDLGAQYTFKLWKSNLALRADIFNVTNEQRTTAVDQTYNTEDTSNRQTYPYFKMERGHQTARRVRLAVRWTF